MFDPHVLIEASSPYADDASDLLVAARFKPVRNRGTRFRGRSILHQIAPSIYRAPAAKSIDQIIRGIRSEVNKTFKRHHAGQIVFCVPGMPGKEFVRVIAGMVNNPGSTEPVELAHTVPDAVARIIQRSRVAEPEPASRKFSLDEVPDIASLGDDLRDDATGRLDAQKVKDLFGVKMAAIADAAGISRQALDQNPCSEKAQPVLKLFERIARLRANPQFSDSADLRKWFRRPLPLFSNHSAEDLFKAGRLDVVATKVDEMLTGDFGG
jgi:transcriptional regulator with XRE-family HTH domain